MSDLRGVSGIRARYQTLFENTGTATIFIDADMTIAKVNSELVRLSGIAREKIEGVMKFPCLISQADRAMAIENHTLRRRDPAAAPRIYPCRVNVANDAIQECILTAALIQGTDQSVVSITDITRQKQLEQKISRICREERQKMGQVLHDDLGSHLAGVEAMAALLAGRLARQGHGDAPLAAEIKALVHQAMDKTRAMVRGLLPVDLEKLGFLPAVRLYAREVERAFGVECRIMGAAVVPFSDMGSLTHAFYIIRESVHNAVKHGRASVIEIQFVDGATAFGVDILDNGRGVDARGPEDRGFGLYIMEHRARLVGGTLGVVPRKGG
ncbi:MAG: PAS domain S-box protein, partial [Desulfovibrionales bacterium]|nr:PAS domain S-box protein [Desulfovibrionales bacterium]